jgi:ankyrin repeat protein
MTNNDNIKLVNAIINKNNELALSIINNNDYDPNYILTDFNHNDSILIKSIDERLSEVALALLNNPKININYTNSKNNSAIFYAIKQKLNSVFDKLINMKCDVSITNFSGNTPLMAAIFVNNLDYMEAIVNLGNFNPGQVNSIKDTALLMLCRKYDSNIELIEENKIIENVLEKIINTGESNSEMTDRKGNTALIYCCKNKIEKIAKLLIETGKSLPNQKNKNNETALMYCCSNNLMNIIEILLDIPEVDPGHLDNNKNTSLMISVYQSHESASLLLLEKTKEKCLPYNINNRSLTALIIAVDRKMINLISELLKFDTDKIDLQIFNTNTALLLAVKNKNKDIAIKILESGKADPYIKDELYLSTYDYALRYDMNDLLNQINETNFKPKNKEIPLNKVVKDIYSQEDYKIGDWINESIDNIVFALPDSEEGFILEKRENLNKNLNNKIFCICYKDNGNQENTNVNEELYLYNGRSIGLFGFFLFTDINRIYKTSTKNNLDFTNKQLFFIDKVNCKNVESVVNHFYHKNDVDIRRRGMIPPAGCTPGKGGKIYRIFPAEPDIYDYMDEKLNYNMDMNITNENNKRNIENINEYLKPNLNVNIKVKENEIYNFEINDTTTIGKLKELLLEKIKENGISQKPTLRLLMYLGENFSSPDKDGMNVINIKNFQNGATFSPVMIGKQTGGKTMKNKKKNKNTNTRKNKKIRKNKKTIMKSRKIIKK